MNNLLLITVIIIINCIVEKNCVINDFLSLFILSLLTLHWQPGENTSKKRESGGPNEIVACTSCGGSASPCTHSANNGCATEVCPLKVVLIPKQPNFPIISDMFRAGSQERTTASDSCGKNYRCYSKDNISHSLRCIFNIFLHPLQRLLLENTFGFYHYVYTIAQLYLFEPIIIWDIYN